MMRDDARRTLGARYRSLVTTLFHPQRSPTLTPSLEAEEVVSSLTNSVRL